MVAARGRFCHREISSGPRRPRGRARKTFDFPPIDRERGYDVIELLDGLAKEKGSTIPRLALSWLLQQDGITTLIVGAKKLEQLEDNLAAVDVTWTDQELEQVAAASAPPSLYPNWMLEMFRRQ